jgi:hypothetical protein
MALRPKEQFNQSAVGNVAKQILLVKTADQSITANTTLASETALAFSVKAGETWAVEYLLDVGAVLSTTGIKLSVNVPASSTVNVSAVCVPSVVTAADEYEKRSATGSATLTFAAAKLAAATDAQFRIVAYIAPTLDGTVTLQFAQATSDAGNVTVRAGSFVRALKLAP